MAELQDDTGQRNRILKQIVKNLCDPDSLDQAKRMFKTSLGCVSSAELNKAAEQLAVERIPAQKIRRLAYIHLDIIPQTPQELPPDVPAWNPAYILYHEHEQILVLAELVKNLAAQLSSQENAPSESDIADLCSLIQKLRQTENHYVREENILFPLLEKRGITGPPQVMWTEHEHIRQIKKSLYKSANVLAGADRSGLSPQELNQIMHRLDSSSTELLQMLSNHFYKENNILFPTSLKMFTKEEWIQARKEFDEIGYSCFTPQPNPFQDEQPQRPDRQKDKTKQRDMIELPSGSLSVAELQAILNTLPVDITFVDKNDSVRYFNESNERIFPRTRSVLGRTVQRCHPQKSVHIVNKILEDFRSRKRNSAQFWINLNGRLVYIRYFPVRDERGNYLGCLEVTQDITTIRQLTGEKRLLDD